MLKLNITQKESFCTFFLVLFLCACFKQSAEDEKKFWKAEIVGQIKSPEITESSGLVNSPCQPEILWTHNDSGGGAFIFAIDIHGNHVATFKVVNAQNQDWEDISVRREHDGKCYLYIGDIGDNSRVREEFAIYKVQEPIVSAKKPGFTSSIRALQTIFKYPVSSHDAEAMLVHPNTGDIYILTKELFEPSEVYVLRAREIKKNQTNVLKKLASLKTSSFPSGLLTGASISFDGRRVALCDYFAIYELELPEQANSFDEIWLQEPKKIEVPFRLQGEAVAYSVEGEKLFATSEQKNSPLFVISRR